MKLSNSIFRFLSHTGPLCRGEEVLITNWIKGEEKGALLYCVVLIAVGCSAYGFSIGVHNGWEMAANVSGKLPAIIFLTLSVSVLFCGALSSFMRSGIGFLANLKFLLIGFAIMGLILSSLSPISFFASIAAPSPGSPGSHTIHSTILILHTVFIVSAGFQAHACLLKSVRSLAATPSAGNRVFYTWIACNLMIGAPVFWVLHPDSLRAGSFIQTSFQAISLNPFTAQFSDFFSNMLTSNPLI